MISYTKIAVSLALLASLARPAAALDVKLWPLFHYHQDAHGDGVHWSALGPLVEFERTAEWRDLRIRPLLWLRERRGPIHDDRAEVLFPLMSTRWQEGYQSFRFLLFTYRTGRFTLFPFAFYRSSPERGSRFGVFPFYLRLDDFLGYQEVDAILFPAYLRLVEPRVDTRFYGFPFVSRIGGADGRGLRLWPFYGRKEIAGRERTRYVLWPFHVRSERLVPGYGWEARRLDLPILASLDGPRRHTRVWGIDAYAHTLDERLGSEAVGAPWPFVFRERALGERDWRVWRLAPIYGRTDRDGVSSRFYGWPVYRTKTQEAGDFHYRRREVMLVLWRAQELESERSGRRERLVTMFPALRSARENGRAFGQVPALMDSLLPANRGVLALWAPLYAAVRWDTGPSGRRDLSLLWGLVKREGGRVRGPWHLELDGAGGFDGD